MFCQRLRLEESINLVAVQPMAIQDPHHNSRQTERNGSKKRREKREKKERENIFGLEGLFFCSLHDTPALFTPFDTWRF